MDSDIRFAIETDCYDQGFDDVKIVDMITNSILDGEYSSPDEFLCDKLKNIFTNSSDLNLKIESNINVHNLSFFNNNLNNLNQYNFIQRYEIINNFNHNRIYDRVHRPPQLNFGLPFLFPGTNINNLALNNVPLVLTDTELINLHDFTLDELKNVVQIDNSDKCPICCGDILENENNETFCVLKCKHYFHSNCIKQHLANYDYHCPICREPAGEHIAKIE